MKNINAMVNDIETKLSPYFNEFVNSFMTAFDKEVDLRMRTGRSKNTAVMKEYYDDYSPKAYKRTYNLFNNVYRKKIINASPSHKLYFNKEMEVSFSGAYLKKYKGKREVRNAVFESSFMNGRHGSNIFFKGEVPTLSPPPVERASEYLAHNFEELTKKYTPKFRKTMDSPIRAMFSALISDLVNN